MYILRRGSTGLERRSVRALAHFAVARGWRNTVEIVLLDISNSTKPCPSVLHAPALQRRRDLCDDGIYCSKV